MMLHAARDGCQEQRKTYGIPRDQTRQHGHWTRPPLPIGLESHKTKPQIRAILYHISISSHCKFPYSLPSDHCDRAQYKQGQEELRETISKMEFDTTHPTAIKND